MNQYACFPPVAPCERHNCTKLHNGNFTGGWVQRDERQRERESGGKEILFAFFREQNVELIFWIWKLFYIPSIEEEEEAEKDEEEEAISRPLYTPQWNTPHTHTVTHNQTQKSVKCERITKAHATKRNTHKNKKRKQNKE